MRHVSLVVALIATGAAGCATRHPEAQGPSPEQSRAQLDSTERTADSLLIRHAQVAGQIADVMRDSLSARADSPASARAVAGGDVDLRSDAAASGLAPADRERLVAPVYFVAGTAAIDREARQVLDAKVEVLRRDPSRPLTLVGYGDPAGGPTSDRLAGERASAVRRYLADHGVRVARLRVESRTGGGTRGRVEFEVR